MKKLLLVSALIAVCVGGDYGQDKSSTGLPANKKLTEDDEIRALVAVQLIKDWQSRNERTPKPSIAVDGSKDPAPELLAYLQKLMPGLRAQSGCKLEGEDIIELPGQELETCNVRFEVGKLKRQESPKDGLETSGDTQIAGGGLGVWGCSYELAKDHEHWAIVKTHDCWVS